MLSNDTNADGDPLAFLDANASSANGGTVVSNGGWLFYTPALGFTNTDRFTYTISDGIVVPVTGSVTVNVRFNNRPSPKLTISDLGGGRDSPASRESCKSAGTWDTRTPKSAWPSYATNGSRFRAQNSYPRPPRSLTRRQRRLDFPVGRGANKAGFGRYRFAAWCKRDSTAGRRFQEVINSPTRDFRVAIKASTKWRTNSSIAFASWARER